jgi:hypothetical protein
MDGNELWSIQKSNYISIWDDLHKQGEKGSELESKQTQGNTE